jgi:hypothetical protein
MGYKQQPSVTNKFLKSHNYVIYAVFLLSFFIIFYNLFIINYTTSDDVQLALQTFGDKFELAKTSRRLTWFVGLPLAQIWEMQGSSIWWKLPRIIAVFFVYASSYLLVKRTIKNPFALFIAFIPLCFYQNDFEHNAFNAHPGLITWSFTLFATSLFLFKAYQDKQDQKYLLVLSLLLYILSFQSELFPFLLFFMVIYPENFSIRSIKLLKYHFLSLVLFLASYIIFSKGGSVYSPGLGSLAIKTWYTYTFSDFFILKNFNEVINSKYSYINFFPPAVLILFLFYLGYCIFISRKGLVETSAPKNILYASWWFLLGCSLNIPVALTLRYQEWVQQGSASYLYTAISTFCFGISMGYLLIMFIKKKLSLVFFIAITLIGINVGVNYLISQKYFNQQEYSSIRWDIVDEMVDKGLIIQDGCYYAPWLFETNGIVSIRTDDYWEEYLLRRFQIKVNFSKDKVRLVNCQHQVVEIFDSR